MFRAARRTASLTVAISGVSVLYRRRYVLAKTSDTMDIPMAVVTPEVVTPIDVFLVKLYGYNGCPFCGKVKAFLEYYGFEYEEVEVNPITKSELKNVSPGYKKVPVVEIITEDGSYIVKDSAVAISVLEYCLENNVVSGLEHFISQFFTTNEKGKEEVIADKKFQENSDRIFVDDKVLHTVAPNIYPSYAEAIENCKFYMNLSDRYRDTWLGWTMAQISAGVMLPISKRILKKYCDFPDQTAREYLYSSIDKFIERKVGNRFLGGEKPSTADIEAYGVIATMKGTQAMKDLADNKPIFYQWFISVENHVNTHQGRY